MRSQHHRYQNRSFLDRLRKTSSPVVGFLCMVLMINIGAPLAVASSEFGIQGSLLF